MEEELTYDDIAQFSKDLMDDFIDEHNEEESDNNVKWEDIPELIKKTSSDSNE